jgi:hypothetical protein
MSEGKKPNYIGNTYYNEYQGEFSGYSVVISAADAARVTDMLAETGFVKISVRPGREPKKPYSTLNVHTPSANKAEGAVAQKETSDLPF